MQTAYNLLQYEVSLTIFPIIVKHTMGSGMILHLWHINPNLVLRGFVDSLNYDPDSMTRILDVCQELKVNVVELIVELPVLFAFCIVLLYKLAS